MAESQLNAFWRGFGTAAQRRRLILVLVSALVIALLWTFWLATSEREYVPVYPNLAERDRATAIAALERASIPYRIAPDGKLHVPAAELTAARARLAGERLSTTDSAGFELLDQSKFGASQFSEQLKYQRALEGELQRSIGAIEGIDSARVHLALPRGGSLVGESAQPSASVLLNIAPGRSLDAAHVAGIAELVAGSVPNLQPERVTLVDSSGNLLGMGRARNGEEFARLEYVRALEQDIASRAMAIATPLASPAKVRAHVKADVDFAPPSAPGSAAPSAPGDSPIGAAPQTAAASMTPSLRRMSVALVVDNKITSEGTRAWTRPELDQLTMLVAETIGIDASRGDSLRVVNTPFTAPAERATATPWWQDAGVLATIKNVARYVIMALLVVIALVLLLRAARRSAAEAAPAAPARQTPETLRTSDVERDPGAVAQVVQRWVHGNE